MEGLLPLMFRTIAGHQRRTEFYRSLSNCDSGRFSRSSSSVSSPHHTNNNSMLVTPRALVSDSLDDLPTSNLHHRNTSTTPASAAAPAPAAVDLRPAVDGHRRLILDITASIQPHGAAPQSINASASNSTHGAAAAGAAANLRRFNVINAQPVPLLNPPVRTSRHAHNQ